MGTTQARRTRPPKPRRAAQQGTRRPRAIAAPRSVRRWKRHAAWGIIVTSISGAATAFSTGAFTATGTTVAQRVTSPAQSTSGSPPSASPPRIRATSSPSATTSTAGRVFLRITSPGSSISCRADNPQCRFQVSGLTAAGLPSGLQIIVLVDPVNPSGGGWFAQYPPASISPSGAWLQSPAYIGSEAGPAHAGDTLQVEAVLVHADATYRQTSLADLPRTGTPITDVGQITGLVKQSEPVQLTIKTP
jgi:hypothetical protein